MPEPVSASARLKNSVAGGQTRRSHEMGSPAGRRAATARCARSRARASPSACRPFIFQLPATSFRLPCPISCLLTSISPTLSPNHTPRRDLGLISATTWREVSMTLFAAQPGRTMSLPDLDDEPTSSPSEIATIMSGLMLALFLASLDQTIVATSLSTMARDLDGWQLMPWVVSAYLITSTTTTPIYGRLSDLYGRPPVPVVGINRFLGASGVCHLR